MTRETLNYQVSLKRGVFTSTIFHILGFLLVYYVIVVKHANAGKNFEVFTVTLEGGTHLGGVSQIPDKDFQNKKVLPHIAGSPDEPSKPKEAEVVKDKPKDIEKPTVVEDFAKKKAEEEKKLADKIALEKKKKEEEIKRKAEEQKKIEEQKKAKEIAEKEEARKKALQEKENRKNRLNSAVQKATTTYKGESANAGGQGYGAASVGGNAMGGGTVKSLEFLRYSQELETHIKSRWSFLSGNQEFIAKALIEIQRSGVITQYRIIQSSGNRAFDDSVLRAIAGSSPVPIPPTNLYEDFKVVRITFNSLE